LSLKLSKEDSFSVHQISGAFTLSPAGFMTRKDGLLPLTISILLLSQFLAMRVFPK
jgi:hypothetical protein